MTLQKEYQVFSLNPDKGINGKLKIMDNPGYFKWFFGTDSIVFPRYYAWSLPVRVMCKQHPFPREFPTLYRGNWEKPFVRGPVLIFGSTPHGWQRSLSDDEVSFLESLGGLTDCEIGGGECRIGYALDRFGDVQDIELWREEE